jgi:hypothetical protein
VDTDIDGTKVPKCLTPLNEVSELYFIYAEACSIKRHRYWNWTALISHAFAGVKECRISKSRNVEKQNTTHVDVTISQSAASSKE